MSIFHANPSWAVRFGVTWRLIRLIAFGVLLCAVVGGTASRAISSPQEEPQTSEPADGEERAAANGAEVPEEAAEAAAPTWQQQLDQFFEAYVVTPIGGWIFWDMWTGPRYDEGGSLIYRGWLRFGDQELGTSVPFVVVWLLFGGVFLTARMGFINVRAFWHALRLTKGDYDDPNEPGEVTHFQALSAALSATVGLGNIGGVAVAVGTGGPGAVFWMILIGLIGMSTKFTECSLGQLYRTVDDQGHVLGGPMRYLRKGLSELNVGWLGTILAIAFAILCIGASLGGGNAYQINQSLAAVRGGVPLLDEMPWLYGVLMAVFVGLVIIGGIKSIGRVASAIVPFMCVAYMLAAFYILFGNIDAVPTALASIFTEAFNWQSATYGSAIGVMVQGIQRAVFSNEAGIGSAPIAHSAAKTDEPISEGIVALLEPFIDTVLVCTTTALVILTTGVLADPANSDIIASREGAALTLAAFRSGGHEWFGYALFVAVILFAFSTCISWSYYGERCTVQLFGTGASLIYKVVFLFFTFLGSVITATNVLDFSDLMLLGMSLPNLLGVLLLSGIVKRRLDDYWGRYRSGDMLTYKAEQAAAGK